MAPGATVLSPLTHFPSHHGAEGFFYFLCIIMAKSDCENNFKAVRTRFKRLTGAFLGFLGRETVFSVALLLAVVSSFFVPPDAQYLKYIDWRVLAILFSMMIVMEGYKSAGVFSYLGGKILARPHTLRGLCLVLIMLCFFSSMLVTNDVALLTFVPFTIYVLGGEDKLRCLIPVVTLQTVAANLGSMLTPVGNPQNLYLYTLSGLGAGAFCRIMLPYCAVSLLLLLASALLFPRRSVSGSMPSVALPSASGSSAGRPVAPAAASSPDVRSAVLFTVLFVLCLLTVLRILSFYTTLAVVTGVTLALKKKVFASADYFLLLTFIAFFIFVGNIQRIGAVREFLQTVVSGRELIVGVAASQVVSNVPAAILLSGFTTDYVNLVKGVNLGGLGTLIASMASLISYKLFARSSNALKGRYILFFTLANVLFLAILLLLSAVLPA